MTQTLWGNRVHLHIQQQFTCTGDVAKDCDATKSGVYSDIPEHIGIEPFGCLVVQNCLK